jgi:glycosyltransferase involved in cell wall biosynthesis
MKIPAEEGTLDNAAHERAAMRCREAIEKAIAFWDVDLVHLHGIDFYRYAPSGIPTLITLHLPLEWYPEEVLRTNIAGRWFHCVSQSQHEMGRHCRDFLAPIENGVDVGRYFVSHDRGEFALVLGRICPEKGIHLALEAAHNASETLLIAGPVFRYPSHEDYFTSEIEPRLDNQRRFLGHVGFDRKRQLLGAARCLLVPSLTQETSSLVAMEALASGTPVIAFPNGALSKIVQHGRTGFLVKTVEDMARAMKRVEDLEPSVCRAAAQARFGLDRMTADYLNLYEELERRWRSPCGIAR